MRRKMGRITDTEWLASNLDYARAMVSLCADQPDEDLRQWAARLAALWARVPVAAPVAPRTATPVLHATTATPVLQAALPAALESRYIGRLR